MQVNEQPETADAHQEYASLTLAIDDFVAEVTRHHRAHIRCRRGCFLCCVPPRSLFRIEGERIRDAVLRLPGDVRARIRARVENPTRMLCPLLEEGVCLVYRDRPILCRTQGMPLAVERDDKAYDVDYCRLNFQGVPRDFEFGRRHILNLDGTNFILASLNLKLVEAAGLDPEEDGRVCFKKAATGRLVGVPTPVSQEEASEVSG
ncbi:MAG: YkgJ family cysteine cluster protein [Planctomycetes bacterium]|nr:YkgJ family cysteine cluster protein [Planctomycetota bacterium]